MHGAKNVELLTCILLSITNKIQRYTIFWHIPDAVCTVHELLMMGGKTARNM